MTLGSEMYAMFDEGEVLHDEDWLIGIAWHAVTVGGDVCFHPAGDSEMAPDVFEVIRWEYHTSVGCERSEIVQFSI